MKADVWELVSAKVRAKRKKSGLSQREVAHRLGVQKRQVQRWESGRCTIPVESLLLLAKVLDVPAWSLLHGVDEYVQLPEREPLPLSKRRPHKLTKSENKPSLAVSFWRRQETSCVEGREGGADGN
ncbi:MAG TPA: hypothetical protein DCE42_04300 [Myxococcales bacterium]|nr:hypothetical protein [Deltaproteobacteria bacterium]MBK07332.1 hypothetical protein [Deltaproteobacteria bacterium]MBU53250.1 hypothetical protein [Deltaproteobacteria bacterium]HAA53948.1 hypothetical protein [Myxococcales bacterium]